MKRFRPDSRPIAGRFADDVDRRLLDEQPRFIQWRERKIARLAQRYQSLFENKTRATT